MAKAKLAAKVEDRPVCADGLPATGYVRLAQILAAIPVARSTVWYWVTTGKLPHPVKLGPRCSAWRVEDVRRLVMTAPEVTPQTIDPNAAKAVAQRVANRRAAKQAEAERLARKAALLGVV